MVRNNPITCFHCGQNSGFTEEGIMFLVITTDLLCQKCGEVVVGRGPSYELHADGLWNNVSANNTFTNIHN